MRGGAHCGCDADVRADTEAGAPDQYVFQSPAVKDDCDDQERSHERGEVPDRVDDSAAATIEFGRHRPRGTHPADDSDGRVAHRTHPSQEDAFSVG